MRLQRLGYSALIVLFLAGLATAATQVINPPVPDPRSSTFVGASTTAGSLQHFLYNEDASRYTDQFQSYVVSGTTAATSGTLTHTIPAIEAYVNGFYVSQGDTVRTHTASRRTYVFVDWFDTRTGQTPPAAEVSFAGGTGCTFLARQTRLVYAECSTDSTQPIPSVSVMPFLMVDTSGAAITRVDQISQRGADVSVNAGLFAGSDMCAKANAAMASLPKAGETSTFKRGGGRVVVPPGDHYCSTELFIDNAVTGGTFELDLTGAVIHTSGAISAIRARGPSTGTLTIRNPSIDHDENVDALHGIHLDGLSINVEIINPFIYAGPRSGYAAILAGNTDPTSSGTGSFGINIYGGAIRDKNCGAKACYTFGIRFQGSGGNASTVYGTKFFNAGEAISIGPVTGNVFAPNGLLVVGCDFENNTTGGRIQWEDNTVIAGHKFLGNRGELMDQFFLLGGSGTPVVSAGPYFAMNRGSPTVLAHITNASGMKHVNLDYSVTPDQGMFNLPRGVVITPQGGSEDAINILSQGGGRGINIEDSTGADTIINMAWTGTGTEGRISSGIPDNLYFNSIRGISNTGTSANNLRGNITLDGTTPTTVTFPTAEASAAYFPFITCRGDVTSHWVTNLLAASFDIATSGAHNVVCSWFIVR